MLAMMIRRGTSRVIERRACDDAAGVTQKMWSKKADQAQGMFDDDNDQNKAEPQPLVPNVDSFVAMLISAQDRFRLSSQNLLLELGAA